MLPWWHLVPPELTFPKPWANLCAFLMEMIFLSYVRETLYLFWNLPFLKMVLHKTNFFLFSNLGLIMAQQASIPVNCFMARGWHTSCHTISKMHTVEEGPGETPSALRYLSYLINSFLTGLKSVQSLSCVWHFATPWTAGRQASLFITNSWSLLKLMCIESVMPSNHLILCRPLFFPH